MTGTARASAGPSANNSSPPRPATWKATGRSTRYVQSGTERTPWNQWRPIATPATRHARRVDADPRDATRKLAARRRGVLWTLSAIIGFFAQRVARTRAESLVQGWQRRPELPSYDDVRARRLAENGRCGQLFTPWHGGSTIRTPKGPRRRDGRGTCWSSRRPCTSCSAWVISWARSGGPCCVTRRRRQRRARRRRRRARVTAMSRGGARLGAPCRAPGGAPGRRCARSGQRCASWPRCGG